MAAGVVVAAVVVAAVVAGRRAGAARVIGVLGLVARAGDVHATLCGRRVRRRLPAAADCASPVRRSTARIRAATSRALKGLTM